MPDEAQTLKAAKAVFHVLAPDHFEDWDDYTTEGRERCKAAARAALSTLGPETIVELLDAIGAKAKTLIASSADTSLYSRWHASRWNEIRMELSRLCEDDRLARAIIGHASVVFSEIDDLIGRGELNIAAEMIPDLVESVHSIAKMREEKLAAPSAATQPRSEAQR